MGIPTVHASICKQAAGPHLPLRHRAHGRVLHRLGAGDDGPHVELVHHVAVQLTCRMCSWIMLAQQQLQSDMIACGAQSVGDAKGRPAMLATAKEVHHRRVRGGSAVIAC